MIFKHVPEDFIVEEIPLKNWDDEGVFAVFKLVKIGMNTEHAISIISRRFNIPSNIIKYSGTKDRHARTTQFISIPKKSVINSLSNNTLSINEENIILEHVGFNDEPLSLGTLKGNKFIITIRDLSTEEMRNLKHNFTNNLDKFIVPNYFDEQRFSSNNYDVGLNIIKGNYKEAVRLICEGNESFSETSKEYMARQSNDYIGAIKHLPKKILLLFIHSVQSYIFNEALRDILIDNADLKSIKYTQIDYSIGKFLYYDNNSFSEYTSLVQNLELPGFDTNTMNHYIKKYMDKISLTSRNFIIRALPDLSVEGTTRDCFVDVKNLDIRILSDHAILEFELPKGSYATIVLKGLVSN